MSGARSGALGFDFKPELVRLRRYRLNDVLLWETYA